MKQEKIDRLSEACKKEGFHLMAEYNGRCKIDGKECLMVMIVDDPWENVEFVKWVNEDKFKGAVYRAMNIFSTSFDIYADNGKIIPQFSRDGWEPTTEEEYVDYLKLTANVLFGEIKDGQKFKFGEYQGVANPQDSYEFKYIKSGDRLWVKGVVIYEKGVWAEKVEEPETTLVCQSWHNNDNISWDLQFNFRTTRSVFGMNNQKTAEYLLKCLDEYLKANK